MDIGVKLYRYYLLQSLLGGLLVVLLPLQGLAMPTGDEVASLGTMEQTLYNVAYQQEPLEKRLDRLEQTVFGSVQPNQTPEERIHHLQDILKAQAPATANNNTEQLASETPVSPRINQSQTSSSNKKSKTSKVAAKKVVPLTPAFQKDTTVLPKSYQANWTQNKPAAATSNPDESDYPLVSEMERRVLGQTYLKEELSNRLQRLETRVYGGPQLGPLADRVDALKLAVLGDTGNGANSWNPQDTNNAYNLPAQQQAYPQADSSWYTPQAPSSSYGQVPQTGAYGANNSGYSEYMPGSNNPNNNNAYGGDNNYGNSVNPGNGMNNEPMSPDMLTSLTKVEKHVLHQTFPADTPDTRLGRLEMKIFNRTNPDSSPDDRLQRIITVASAGGDNVNRSASAKSTFIKTAIPVLIMLLPLLL